MTITPLSQIPQISPGTKLPCVQGTVCEVWEYKNGSNARGAWSFQNILLRDSTGEIEVNLKSRPAFPIQQKGAWIVIEAQDGDSGKPKGIAVDDYNGKLRLQVDNRAMFHVRTSEQPLPQTRAPLQGTLPGTAPQSQFSDPAYPPQGGQGPAEKEAPDFVLIKCANGFVRCLEAALHVRTQIKERTGHDLTDDDVRQIATSFFIKLDKDRAIPHVPYKLPPRKAPAHTEPDPRNSVQPAAPAPQGPSADDLARSNSGREEYNSNPELSPSGYDPEVGF